MSQTDNDIAAQLAKETPDWIFKIDFVTPKNHRAGLERFLRAEAQKLEPTSDHSDAYLFET